MGRENSPAKAGRRECAGGLPAEGQFGLSINPQPWSHNRAQFVPAVPLLWLHPWPSVRVLCGQGPAVVR